MVWRFPFIHLPVNCQYYKILSAECNYSDRMSVSGQANILLTFGWKRMRPYLFHMQNVSMSRNRPHRIRESFPLTVSEIETSLRTNKLVINVNPAFRTKLCYETIKNKLHKSHSSEQYCKVGW